jgi:hypothetical protein
MGSATSWDLPGHHRIVCLCGPGESAIVAGGFSETGANRGAEAINKFLGHVFGRPTSTPFFRDIKGLTVQPCRRPHQLDRLEKSLK